MKAWHTLLIVCCAARLAAQSGPMPRETALLVGWHQCFLPRDTFGRVITDYSSGTPFGLPTLAIERTLMRHGSFQFGLGLDAITHPKHPDYKKLNTQVFAELRYYMLLRRGRPTSGIYIGLFADLDRERWIYRDGGNVAVRKSYENAGPSIGYQHAWGKHFRFNEGVMAVIQSTIRENRYGPDGQITDEINVLDQWYSYYWYFKMGFVF